MSDLTNVLLGEFEYNPADSSSRAAWNAWLATAAEIDTAYENFGTWCHQKGVYTSATYNPSGWEFSSQPRAHRAPVIVPCGAVSSLGNYSLESISAYCDRLSSGKPSMGRSKNANLISRSRYRGRWRATSSGCRSSSSLLNFARGGFVRCQSDQSCAC